MLLTAIFYYSLDFSLFEKLTKAANNLYLRGLLILNTLRNLSPENENDDSVPPPRESQSMRRAVTSRSIRHHEWIHSNNEEPVISE